MPKKLSVSVESLTSSWVYDQYLLAACNSVVLLKGSLIARELNGMVCCRQNSAYLSLACSTCCSLYSIRCTYFVARHYFFLNQVAKCKLFLSLQTKLLLYSIFFCMIHQMNSVALLQFVIKHKIIE